MGDPRKLRKKYSKPSHPWQKLRIDSETILMKEYGFKNKKELWKLDSLLSKFKTQAKDLIPMHGEAADLKKKELLLKLQRLNLIKDDAILEDILTLTLKDLCERRLQTRVMKKGLARTIKQARQFITHEHILIGDRKITSPSFIVSSAHDAMIRFTDSSALVSEEHPERAVKPKDKPVAGEAV